MSRQYDRAGRDRRRLWPALKRWMVRDYRSRSSRTAFEDVIGSLTRAQVALSIGGGPLRAHPVLRNVNIGLFPNVDVVGDAHRLPYADDCVDAIFCEAVLEHLESPSAAVSEMRRVLRPGGRVLAITPFLQAYHGYPGHFQNFTLRGHERLFANAGLVVERSGTCVGPVYTLLNLGGTFLSRMLPGPLSWIARKIWILATLPLHPLDRVWNDRKVAHVLASTTFVVAVKPGSSSATVAAGGRTPTVETESR